MSNTSRSSQQLSPSKRLRLSSSSTPTTPPLSVGQSSSSADSSSYSSTVPELSKRFYKTLASLPARYDHGMEDDVIDLRTGEVVVNPKGLLSTSQKCWSIGCFSSSAEAGMHSTEDSLGADPVDTQDEEEEEEEESKEDREEDELDLINSETEHQEAADDDIGELVLPQKSLFYLPPLAPDTDPQDAEDLQAFLLEEAKRRAWSSRGDQDEFEAATGDEYSEILNNKEAIESVAGVANPHRDEGTSEDDMDGYDAGEGSIVRKASTPSSLKASKRSRSTGPSQQSLLKKSPKASISKSVSSKPLTMSSKGSPSKMRAPSLSPARPTFSRSSSRTPATIVALQANVAKENSLAREIPLNSSPYSPGRGRTPSYSPSKKKVGTLRDSSPELLPAPATPPNFRSLRRNSDLALSLSLSHKKLDRSPPSSRRNKLDIVERESAVPSRKTESAEKPAGRVRISRASSTSPSRRQLTPQSPPDIVASPLIGRKRKREVSVTGMLPYQSDSVSSDISSTPVAFPTLSSPNKGKGRDAIPVSRPTMERYTRMPRSVSVEVFHRARPVPRRTSMGPPSLPHQYQPPPAFAFVEPHTVFSQAVQTMQAMSQLLEVYANTVPASDQPSSSFHSATAPYSHPHAFPAFPQSDQAYHPSYYPHTPTHVGHAQVRSPYFPSPHGSYAEHLPPLTPPMSLSSSPIKDGDYGDYGSATYHRSRAQSSSPIKRRSVLRNTLSSSPGNATSSSTSSVTHTHTHRRMRKRVSFELRPSVIDDLHFSDDRHEFEEDERREDDENDSVEEVNPPNIPSPSSSPSTRARTRSWRAMTPAPGINRPRTRSSSSGAPSPEKPSRSRRK